MKKFTTLLISLFLLSGIAMADTIEVYSPDFRYENTQRGYITQNIIAADTLNGDDTGNVDLIWKRVGRVPSETELGYTRSSEFTSSTQDKTFTRSQKSLTIQSHTDDSIYITDSYVIIDPINLSAQSATSNFELTFFTYLVGANHDSNIANFEVMLSTDYTDDVTTANWEDITTSVTLADELTTWTKASYDLTSYKSETVTIAFRYSVDNAASNNNDAPAMWNLSDVRVTAIEKDLSAYTDTINTWNFANWDKLELANIIGSTKWIRANGNGKVAPNAPTGSYSLKVTAVDNSNPKENTTLEAWAILGEVDCSTYKTDLLFSIWSQVEWLGTTGVSTVTVKYSTDYTPIAGDSVTAINNATWSDVAIGLDQQNHDFNESKGLIPTGGESSVYIAVVYENTTTGVADGNADRAGTWYIGDISLVGIEDTPTALNPVKAESIKVYPNPSTGMINFSEEVASAKVYSIQGRMVKSLNAATTQLDISSLGNGIYFVESINNGQTTMTRVIKK